MSLEQIETGSFAPQGGISHPPRGIRVVSWNIARGSRLDDVTEYLVGANADLILLQEVDKHARRTAYRNIAAHIAQKLKLHYAFGIEFQELGQSSSNTAAYHGQVTLSRWPLSDSHVLRFHNQSTFWQPRWWIPAHPRFQRRLGGRMALLSHVSIAQTVVAVYNLHLESRGPDALRRSQLEDVVNDTLRHGINVPVIMAGDLNFNLTERCNAHVTEERAFHNPFADLQMCTARSRPWARKHVIDWILTRGPIVPVSPNIDQSVAASDHYPLSLTLELQATRRPGAL